MGTRMDVQKRDDFLGLRIAWWRAQLKISQQELGDRVGVSRSQVNMIENGSRLIVKRQTLIDFAVALEVNLTDLTGQPTPPRSIEERAVNSALPGLRAALDGPDEEPPVRDLAALRADVDAVTRARMAADLVRVSDLLPGLLAELAVHPDERAVPLYIRATTIAALAIKPLGHLDLAMRLAERAERAAETYGDPVHIAAAGFGRAQVALAEGVQNRSLTLANRAAAAVENDTSDDGRTFYGMNRLHAALTLASLGRTDDANAAWTDAADAARAGVERDGWAMEFTPANVGVWRVSLDLENGDAGRAPEHARAVNPAALRTAERRGRLHIETARGLYLMGDHAGATAAFLEADRITPFSTRPRPTVREIVGHMLRDARIRAGSDGLRTLAVACGVDPWADLEQEGTT